MSIIRAKHDDDHPFAGVTRPVAQNKALSYEALGMLTYLLSQADDWVVGVDNLIREGCGRDKAYRILKELSEAGHLAHVRIGVGQCKPPVWAERTVYEQPFTEMPDFETPDTPSTKSVKAGFGEPISPVPEKAYLANTSKNPRNPEKPDTVKPSREYGTALNAFTDQEPKIKAKDKSAKNARAHEYGFKVDLTLVEGAAGSIRFDDGALLNTSDRPQFIQAALTLYGVYWETLVELGRAPVGGKERAWDKHQLAALTLALARVTPDEIQRYMVAQYRGNDPFWQNKPMAMSLKHVAENLRAWQARTPPPYSNGNGNGAHAPAEPVYQERPVDFDANMMLREMKARGEYNPGWLPPLRVPLNRKANADE